MCIVGFMFCKRDLDLDVVEDNFYGLLNPNQTDYVDLKTVEEFLIKL